MLALLLATSLSLAGEPAAVVEGDVVRGTARLAVPPQRFLDALRDPTWEARVSGSSTTAEVKGRDGACLHVAYVSPNPVVKAAYEVRRCPVPNGWQSTLLASNVFEGYRAAWHAVPDGDGAQITYEIELSTSLWVPNSLVRGETRKSVLKMMRAMAAWSAAPGEE